jgi:putative oxidoreductase
MTRFAGVVSTFDFRIFEYKPKPMLERYTLNGLRIFVSVIFITHAIQRAVINQTVGGFGEFLESKGFPLGFFVAWFITLYEFIGGASMAFNKGTKYVAIGFVIHQIMGIALVHAQNGWFVVGAGSGGMEYSALLIVALGVIFGQAYGKK